MPQQLATNKAADLIDIAVLLSKNIGKQIPCKTNHTQLALAEEPSELGYSRESKSSGAWAEGERFLGTRWPTRQPG